MKRNRRGADRYENVIRRKLCKNFPRFPSRKNENWERRGSCHVVFLDVTFPPSYLRRFLSPICWWKTSEKRWWCWNVETHGRGKSEEIPQRFSWHFSSTFLNFSFPIFSGNDYRYVQMGIWMLSDSVMKEECLHILQAIEKLACVCLRDFLIGKVPQVTIHLVKLTSLWFICI